MKSNSIIVEGSVKKSSKNAIQNDLDDMSPPPSPTGQLRARWTHNPVVLSMLACSSMQNCDEVKEIYRECVARNDKDSMICEAAAKYHKMCHLNNGSNNGVGNVLDFTPYHES